MTREGIPDSIRGQAWMALTGADRKLEAGRYQVHIRVLVYLGSL
jgi:hypothetical protein